METANSSIHSVSQQIASECYENKTKKDALLMMVLQRIYKIMGR